MEVLELLILSVVVPAIFKTFFHDLLLLSLQVKHFWRRRLRSGAILQRQTFQKI